MTMLVLVTGVLVPCAGLPARAGAATTAPSTAAAAAPVAAKPDGNTTTAPTAAAGGETAVVLADVVVTASRRPQPVASVPGRITVITGEELRSQPYQKLDEALAHVAGVTTSRQSGSDMRPVVGLRGLGSFEQGRTLVLVDGVPVNKTDSGDVNWNRLSLADVERIEVMKGPGSAMYGNNAMGGVINVITRAPADRLTGHVTTAAGTNETYSGDFTVAGRPVAGKPLYLSLSGAGLTTEGHYGMSADSRARLAAGRREKRLYVDEWSVSPKVGLEFDEWNGIELGYSHYADTRSEGVAGDHRTEGEFRHFTTDAAHLQLKGGEKSFNWRSDTFFQLEQYYKLYDNITPRADTDTDSDRLDYGTQLNASAPFLADHNTLTGGIDLKQGSVDATDVDRTGGGRLANEGRMQFAGLFLQDDFRCLDERLRLSAGLRQDWVWFTDGAMTASPGHLFAPYIAANPPADQEWTALSPRLSARYAFTKRTSAYASWSRGFRAPELDDLCRTGYQYVGPKIANPDLGPETIDTWELGMEQKIGDKLTLTPSLFYSRGTDFLYYVQTTIPYQAGRNYSIKENVGEVEVYGAELELRYAVNAHVTTYANYTYSRSEILEYETPALGAGDLTGRTLRDAPEHMVNAGVDLLSKWVNVNVNARWKGRYYTDDLNSRNRISDPFVLVDVKLWRELADGLSASLSVQNLLDDRTTGTPGGNGSLLAGNSYSLSSYNPGRTVTVALTYSF